MSAPLWVTVRGPVQPLNYNAMRRVLQRANDQLGANVTLHDLRHYADGWVMCPAVAFPLAGAAGPVLQSA